MTDIQRNLGVGIVLALLLAGGAYYLLGSKSEKAPAGTGAVASTTDLGGGVSISNTGGATIERVDAAPTPPLTAISITADLPAEAKTIMRSKIEAQYDILRKEPARVDIWLQLGVNRKIVGDFSGAIAAWNYVAATAPIGMVATARGNLADLYLYFLKDYKKAQTNYSAAIAANPQVIDYYRGLFYLYKDINKDPAAAAALIEKGLKANPDNADLLALKALL